MSQWLLTPLGAGLVAPHLPRAPVWEARLGQVPRGCRGGARAALLWAPGAPRCRKLLLQSSGSQVPGLCSCPVCSPVAASSMRKVQVPFSECCVCLQTNSGHPEQPGHCVGSQQATQGWINTYPLSSGMSTISCYAWVSGAFHLGPSGPQGRECLLRETLLCHPPPPGMSKKTKPGLPAAQIRHEAPDPAAVRG